MNNNISLLKIINGLSKTINIANQMLPLYNKIKPIISNGSKLISNLNNVTIPTQKPTSKTVPLETSPKKNNNNLPTFFQ